MSVRNIKPEEIKPLIGNISRPNYYQVVFGGLSSGLSGYLNSRGVDNQFIGSDMGLMCYNASLPGSSLATVEATNFHGVTENFAHTKLYTTLDLSFYCDREYKAKKFLEHWMEYVVSGNGTGNSDYSQTNYNHRLRYPNDPGTGYKSQATKIFKFENDYKQILEYSFIGLFPSNLSSTQVQYGTNSEITRVNCSFKYDRYIAGSISSYDSILGTSNNLLSTVRDITSNGIGLINRLFN